MQDRGNSIGMEVQRLVSRAQRLSAATSKSPAILSWALEDVDHMAEAATMLWDQAQSIAQKDARHKHELNAAISKIFEPLLMFSGRFKLSARLAATRLRQSSSPPPELAQAHSFRLLMLALEFRFEDNFEWERQATYDEALSTYQSIHNLMPQDPLSVALMALSMNYLGLFKLADTLAMQLAEMVPIHGELDLNDAMPAPKFWKDSYASPLWHTWSGPSREEQ